MIDLTDTASVVFRADRLTYSHWSALCLGKVMRENTLIRWQVNSTL